MVKRARKKRKDAGKPKPAALSFEEKRAKWRAEVAARLQMNVTLTDPATDADYPEPPKLDKTDTGSRNDYVKDRLSGAAVVMIERRLKRLAEVPFDSKEARSLEADILDRAGFTRKPQQQVISTGPVLFIGDMEEAKKAYQAKIVDVSAAKAENPLSFPSIVGETENGRNTAGIEGNQPEHGTDEGSASRDAGGSERPADADALGS